MTAEGTFPKIAGDIAYASEANKFNASYRCLYIGSMGLVTSGAGVTTDIGSFVIGAGSLTNPCHIILEFVASGGAANVLTPIGLQVSGLSANNQVNITTADIGMGRFDCYVGSPLCGRLKLIGNSKEGDQTSGFASSSILINNLNTSASVVLKLRGGGKVDNINVVPVIISTGGISY